MRSFDDLDALYRDLPEGLARTYRNLAVYPPGGDITARLATPLIAPDPAENHLDALVARGLLSEHTPGRYRMHAHVRAHAAAQARTEVDKVDRAYVVALIRDAAALAQAADHVLRPYAHPHSYSPNTDFASEQVASTWLLTEAPTLVLLAELAVEVDRPTDAIALAEGLWPLVLHHKKNELWLRAARLGIASARDRGDLATEAKLLAKRALAVAGTEEALSDLAQAEQIWQQAGNQQRLAQVLQRRGHILHRAGRLDEALAALKRAEEIDTTAGVDHNRGITLLTLARLHLDRGDAAAAVQVLGRARPLLEKVHPLRKDDQRNLALVDITLGRAQAAVGSTGQAHDHLSSALEVMGQLGSKNGQAEAWEGLAELALHRNAPDQARQAYTRALDLLDPGPDRDRVRAHLDQVADQ